MRSITQITGTIDDMQGNITTLHLHCNFPGISHIHHHFQWFKHGHRLFHFCPNTATREKDHHHWQF